MATKTINIRETAYEALVSRKRSGESFSDVILRIAGEGQETESVCDFLDTLAPALRSDIAKAAREGKRNLAGIRPRKVSL